MLKKIRQRQARQNPTGSPLTKAFSTPNITSQAPSTDAGGWGWNTEIVQGDPGTVVVRRRVPLAETNFRSEEELMSASDLDGDVQLRVQLPSGRVVFFTSSANTPLMDILIRLSSQFGFSPTSYTLKVPSDRPYSTHSPNTPIGRLPTTHLEVVPKVTESRTARPNKPEGRNHVSNLPFEPTIRIQADFPKKLKTVLRVSPKTTIGEIHWELCRQQEFDPKTLIISDIRRPDTPLSADITLADSGATHFLFLPATAASLHRSTGDLFGDFSRMSVEEKERIKRKGGLFSNVFGKKKRAPSKPNSSERRATSPIQQTPRGDSLKHGSVQILTEQRPNGVNYVSSKLIHTESQSARPTSVSGAVEANKKRPAPLPPPAKDGVHANGFSKDRSKTLKGNIESNLSVEIHQPSFSTDGEELAENMSPLKSEHSSSISPGVSHLSSSKSSIAAGDDAISTNKKLLLKTIKMNTPIREHVDSAGADQSIMVNGANQSVNGADHQSPADSPTKNGNALLKKKHRAPPPPSASSESPSSASSSGQSDTLSHERSPPTSKINSNPTPLPEETAAVVETGQVRPNSSNTSTTTDDGVSAILSRTTAETAASGGQTKTMDANGKVTNPEEYEEQQLQKRAAEEKLKQQKQNLPSDFQNEQFQQTFEGYQWMQAAQSRQRSVQVQQQLVDQEPTAQPFSRSSTGRSSKSKSVNSPQVPTNFSEANYDHSSSSKFGEAADDAASAESKLEVLHAGNGKTGTRSNQFVSAGSSHLAESPAGITGGFCVSDAKTDDDANEPEPPDPEPNEILLSTSRIGLNFVGEGGQNLLQSGPKNDPEFNVQKSNPRIGPEDIQVVDDDDLLKSKPYRSSVSAASESDRVDGYLRNGPSSPGHQFVESHRLVLKKPSDFQISPRSDGELDLDITPHHHSDRKLTATDKVYLQTFAAADSTDLRSSADSGIGSPSVDEKQSSISSSDSQSLSKKSSLYLKNHNQSSTRSRCSAQLDRKADQLPAGIRETDIGASVPPEAQEMSRLSTANRETYGHGFEYRPPAGIFSSDNNDNNSSMSSRYSSMETGAESDFGFSRSDLQYMHQMVQASGRNHVSGTIYAATAHTNFSTTNYHQPNRDGNPRISPSAQQIETPTGSTINNLQERLHAEYDKLQEMFLSWQGILSQQKQAFERKTRISPQTFAKFQAIQEDLYQQHNLVQYLCSLAQQEDDSGSESGQRMGKDKRSISENKFVTAQLTQPANPKPLTVQPAGYRSGSNQYGSDRSSSSAANSGLSSPDHPSNSSSGEAMNYAPPVRDNFADQIRRKSRSGWSANDEMARYDLHLKNSALPSATLESQDYSHIRQRVDNNANVGARDSFNVYSSTNGVNEYSPREFIPSSSTIATSQSPSQVEHSEVNLGGNGLNQSDGGHGSHLLTKQPEFHRESSDVSVPNNHGSLRSPRQMAENDYFGGVINNKSKTLPRAQKTNQGQFSLPESNRHPFSSSTRFQPQSQFPSGEVFRSVKSYTNDHPIDSNSNDYSGGYYRAASSVSSVAENATLPRSHRAAQTSPQHPGDVIDTSSVVRPSMLRSTSNRVIAAAQKTMPEHPTVASAAGRGNVVVNDGRFSPSSVVGNPASLTLMLDARSPSPAFVDPTPIRNYGLRNCNEATSVIANQNVTRRYTSVAANSQSQPPSVSPVLYKNGPMVSPKSQPQASPIINSVSTSSDAVKQPVTVPTFNDELRNVSKNFQLKSSLKRDRGVAVNAETAAERQPLNESESSKTKNDEPLRKSDFPPGAVSVKAYQSPSITKSNINSNNNNSASSSAQNKPERDPAGDGLSKPAAKTSLSTASMGPPKAPPPPNAPAPPPIIAQMAAVKLKPAGERKIKGTGAGTLAKSNAQANAPTVDPHDQLLASIRSFGGTRGLKKSPVSANSTAAIQ